MQADVAMDLSTPQLNSATAPHFQRQTLQAMVGSVQRRVNLPKTASYRLTSAQ
jgi:hypothetical protein